MEPACNTSGRWRMGNSPWNLVDPGTHGAAKYMNLYLRSLHAASVAHVYRLDALHSNVPAAYEKVGSPQYPTTTQIKTLRDSAALSLADTIEMRNETLQLHLLENELALIIRQ